MHLQEAASALGLLLGRVVNRRARRHYTGINADEAELTDERIGHDLERERRKRGLVGCRTLDLRRLGLVWIESDDRRDVERRRQIIDDRVEHRLHTFVLESRAAMTGTKAAFSFRTDSMARFRRAPLISSSVSSWPWSGFSKELVVSLADLFDQLLPIVLRFGQHVGGDVANDVVGAHGFVFVGDRLHLDQVQIKP